MPKVNDKVLAMVRQEMEKDLSVKNKALLAKARRIDRSVGRMSLQQFHATYRLRVTRDMAAASRPRKRARKVVAKAPARTVAKAAAPTVNRDAVRAVLLELATVVAAADKAAMIGVVGSLDGYVDRVLAAR